MAELIVAVLRLVGLFAAKWLLPSLSGGRLVVMRDAPFKRFQLVPYVRLPDGRIAVDGEVGGIVLLVLLILLVFAVAMFL